MKPILNRKPYDNHGLASLHIHLPYLQGRSRLIQ
jgi:hypothetical protein